jgi:2'-5' RNA ligase
MVTENSRPIRSFIAIDIPPEVKSGLSALQNSLRHLGAAVSWTRPEGVHLTLKFLGDVTPSSLPDIVKGLHDAVESAIAFPVIVEGVGSFPNPRRPRVLWVGLQGGEPLSKLQESVESAIEPLGFPREHREFHPHLTLGRVKAPHGVERVVQEMERLGFPRREFTAAEVRLMKSELKPTGAEYTLIHSVPLINKAV